MRYSQTIVGDFLDFARTRDPNRELTYVSEYFDLWMRSGNAIEATAGDHDLFLQVFLLVAHQFASDPDLFGAGREYPMEGLLRLDSAEGEANEPPDCMVPEWWNHYVFLRKWR